MSNLLEDKTLAQQAVVDWLEKNRKPRPNPTSRTSTKFPLTTSPE